MTVLALSPVPVRSEALQAMAQLCQRCEVVVVPAWRSVLRSLLALPGRVPLQTAYYAHPAVFRRLEAICAHTRFDVVLAHLLRMVPYAKNVPAGRKILDLTDALSLAYTRTREVLGGRMRTLKQIAERVEATRIRETECDAVCHFDRTLLISHVDLEYMVQYVDPARLAIVGPGVDLRHFSFSRNHANSHEIVFLGKLSTVPNHDGLVHFLRDIFPLVRQMQPSARLTVIGIEAGRKIRALHSDSTVNIVGAVDDVRPYLRRAAVSICPMRLGAGVKNKVLEAMAVGTPVVTTPIGAAGIEMQNGVHGFIAEAPGDFARSVGRLLAAPELRRQMAEKARRLVEQRYGWENALCALDAEIENAEGRLANCTEYSRSSEFKTGI